MGDYLVAISSAIISEFDCMSLVMAGVFIYTATLTKQWHLLHVHACTIRILGEGRGWGIPGFYRLHVVTYIVRCCHGHVPDIYYSYTLLHN